MKKLLSLALSLLFLFTVTACSTNTGSNIPVVGNIGDGKVDEVEVASIGLVVGAFLYANPKLIRPTYDVSSVLLAVIDNKTVTSVALLDDFVNKEVDKLKFDKVTLQSFKDLIKLVKAKIVQDLTIANIPESQKLVIVRDVVSIVQQSAYVRL